MPEDKRLTVGLSFTADTSKARQEIDKLKNDLSNIISNTNVGKVNSSQFNQVINQAAQLRGILEKATSATGKLDLSKFERSVKAANIDLKTMAQEFQKIDGGQFFNGLAQQIMAADTKVNILSGTLKKFAQGLMNTAMWTIQSNAIHAVEGALSSAYNYAQKLNKGLTDIAIVSDLNTEQLTNFAKTANQMAKDLSASTSDVVSGALIYYQAGLSDEEVIKRTETTIKLAQTSGESAEQISSYMTAIWNNFYDGSKSVEYYADAISYLGAVTAASNADIAEGMQSFAATAETVGLSFEYAASAMTVIRDVTQQSASTVGNSLKTIFARLSSLKMGDTLEDGVDLTKYSKALESVGVQVLDASGELRAMDDILDDLAVNWDKLTQAQKDALAQTVGGVRQYNNLITLMDNYEKFQELVSGIGDSDGYLQGQADEYAASWEGAKNRLQAAWQGIYDQLIDDKFFIKLTNFGATIVNFISQIIDGAGGLKGVISMLIMGITSLNPEKFAHTLTDIKDTILLIKDALTGVQEKANIDFKSDFLDTVLSANSKTSDENILKLYDDIGERIRKIADLRAIGDTEAASREAVLFDRRMQEIVQLEKKSELLEKINEILQEADMDSKTENRALAMGQTANLLGTINSAKNTNDKVSTLQDIFDKNLFNDNQWLTVQIAKALEAAKIDATKAVEDFRTVLEDELGEGLAVLSDQIHELPPINDVLNSGDKGKVEDLLKDIEKQIIACSTAEDLAAKAGAEADSETIKAFEEKKKALHDYLQLLVASGKLQGEILAKAQELTAQIGGGNKKEPLKDGDMSGMVTQATRAASALVSVQSGMDGLIKSIQSGNISFGSLVGSFGSMWMGATRSVDALQKVGTALTGTDKVAALFGGKLSGLGTKLLGLGAPHILAGIAALTAVIWGLKWAMDEAYKASPEGKLEAANKTLQEQEQLVDKLSRKYSETTSTIEKLKDVENTFKGLKNNTVEWTEAVQQNNEAALDLLDTYDLLTDANGNKNYEIDKDGIIRVSEEVLDEVGKRAQAQLANARLSSYALKNIKDAAELEVGKENIATTASSHANQFGEYGPNLNGKTIDDVLSAVQAAGSLEKFLADADAAEWGDWTSLISANQDVKDAISNQIVAMDKNTAAIDARNQQIGQTLAADANVPDWARELLGEKYGEKYTDAYNEAKNKLDDLSANQIANQYKNSDELANAGLHYNEKDKKFYDENNDEVGIEKVRAALAQEIVRVQLTNPETIAELLGQKVNPETGEVTYSKEAEEAKADWEAGEAERERQSSVDWANEEVTEAGFENDEKFASLKESVKDAADEMERLSENVKEDEVALIQVAKAVEQSERGYAELAKNWKSWKEALETGLDEGNIQAYTEALTGTVDALADVMNISDELSESGMQLGDTFRDYVAENLDVVQRAVEGDTDAILELQEVATQDILGQLVQKNAAALGQSEADIQNVVNNTASAWQDIQNMLDSNQLRVGDSIDDGPLYDKLTNIINAVAQTTDEAQQLLAAMGFDAEVELDTEKERAVTEYPKPAEYEEGVMQTSAGPWTYPRMTAPPSMEKGPETETQTVAPALKIKTAKYVGGGNITSKRGGNGKGTGGNGKGKGGGGEKKITPKSKDVSRYHEIKSQLEQTKHYLDMVDMAEGRAYGQKKLDLIDQKIELLKREAEQYGELYKEAKKYYDEDKDVLNSQYGAAFNEDGSIKDYDSWYGHFVDMYNSGKMSDDEWKKFEDAIKKYEQSLKEMNDAEKKTQEDLHKVYDLKLDKVEYRLKTITDLIKMDMEYLDYMLEMLDDDGLDTAEAIAYLSKEIDDITKKYDANKEALAGIFKNHEGVTDDIINQLYSGELKVEDFIETIGDFTQKEIDTIQNIMSSMFENGKDLKKYIEELYKKLDELSDKFQEAINKQIDKLDHFNKMIEKTKNIIDVMGKDTLGISDELLNRMQRSQIEIGKEHIATLQQEIDQYRVWIQELEQQYAVMNPEDLEAKNLKKIIDSYKEVYDGLKEDLLDTTADVGEEIKKYWREIIDQTVEYAGNAISGAIGDFEKMLDMYDKQKKIDDLYLDTYKKTYETNKLLRDINKSINDTDNIKGQKALRDLQKEILGYQDEGVQLTEYQIEERRKYYDLLLAEIALEEAQNAKSQVRMTRDNEGNWSYTYTADQEQVDNLQQNYDDKLFAYEDFNNKTLEGALDTYNQLTQDWLGALSEAATAEEVALINNYYTPMIQAAGQTVDYIMGRNNELTQNFDVNNNEIATSLADTAYGAVTNYETIGEAMDALDVAIEEATESIIDSLQSMDEEQLALAESVGVTEPQVEELINNARDAVDEVHVAVAGDGTDEHPGIAKDFDDEFNGALNTLSAFYVKSGPIINNIINEVGKITHKVNEVIDAYSRLNNTPIVTPDLSGPIGAFRQLEAAANAAAAAAAAAASAGTGVGGGGGDDGGSRKGAHYGGCFDKGTKITMSDGSIKNIEDIVIGDEVIAYNENTKCFEPRKVVKSYVHHNTPAIMDVYFENGETLGITPGHPMLSTNGWKSRDLLNSLLEHNTVATWLEINDEIINLYNDKVKIIDIIPRKIGSNYDTYNIEVETCHTYVAGGMVVHNVKAPATMTAMASGGYTGEWGNEGKIAMLHEKELILNKQDTANMLQTVGFVRDLVEKIGANISIDNFNNLFAGQVAPPGNNYLDQNVTIHAEFPNAVDHSEIEEAFQNLIGLAGQYAGRKQ